MLKTDDYKGFLKDDIESGLKGMLSDKLRSTISSKNFQTELRKNLDGSVEWDGKETDAEDFDKALQNISKRSEPWYGDLPNADLGELTELKIREITANEFSNAVSASVTKWLDEIVVPNFSDTIAEVFSKILSDVISARTEDYIRTAEVYQWNPPGSILLKPGHTIDGPGGVPIPLNPSALPMPNLVPLEYILSPENTWPEELASLRVTQAMPGGIK